MYISINPQYYKKLFWIIPAGAILLVVICLLLGIVSFSEARNLFGYAHEIPLILVGFYVFLNGFERYRKKRLVENIPTSKIRSVAMGLSELMGKAKQSAIGGPLKSPITHTDCVYYRFLIEKERRGYKGRRYWTVVNEGNSTNYFYIEDETGKILVDPLESEVILPKDYEYVDEEIVGISSYRKRYTEWYIQPGEQVYVLGTVMKFKDDVLARKEKLIERLRQLKEDKEKLKKFDINKNGQISVEEWDKAREAIEQKLLEEELKQPSEPEDDIVIAKGDNEKTFIISDHSEKEVTKKIGIKSIYLILGGCCLIIGMFASLLARTGFLPESLIIPWEKFYKD